MEQSIKQSRILLFVALIAVVVLVIMSSNLLEFNYGEALIAYPKGFLWVIRNFYPTPESLAKLPDILTKLYETVLMSISTTTIACVFAFILALFGATATKTNHIISVTARLIASVFRNVPDIVWSMIFLFSFGQGFMTGFLAIFFVSMGSLTRAFIETIDATAGQSIEAMEATGASWWQMVGQAILPNAIAGVISWILYTIEENIRSATLIGMLTGTGIRYLFDLYYKSLNYHVCSLIVIAIILIVLVLEAISNRVRREVL